MNQQIIWLSCIDKEEEMSSKILTIHTATYNRAHTLPRVFESLKKQTCFEFDWFVTDNGSTDGTEKLFEKWKEEDIPFKISYHKIPERGIPRALNYAVQHVSGKYFFILDSDDILLPNGVELILAGIRQIDDFESFVGVGFVRIKENGEPIKGVWPKVNKYGYVDCTNLERRKFDLDADMCEAYKVDILKKYPFQVWPDEVFAPEQTCFDMIALDGYKVRWFKDAIYVCEYLDDGLTVGNWNLLRNNKMGYAILSNQRLLTATDFRTKIRAAAQCIALSINAGYPSYILKSYKPWITFLALPFGLILAVRRHEQFKYDDPVNRRNYS